MFCFSAEYVSLLSELISPLTSARIDLTYNPVILGWKGFSSPLSMADNGGYDHEDSFQPLPHQLHFICILCLCIAGP